MDLFNFDYIVEQWGDPRTKNWFLVGSPWPTIILIILYLLSVKIFLPAYMKNREPYKLTNVLFYYNIFQVILSTYLMYMGFFSGWIRRYPLFQCRNMDRSMDPDAMMAATGCYYYFLAKFTEFFDTIFFVLRKKDNQISFLHLYHHATMPIHSWIATLILPGGLTSKAYAVNSSIHVVMYTYYLLSGLGPKWQKYLWWKKYLTTFQIVQFAYGVSYFVIIYFTKDNCPEFTRFYPLLFYALFYIASLLFLFSQFYFSTYKPSITSQSLHEKEKTSLIVEEKNNNLMFPIHKIELKKID